jgi:phosphoglucosamine mutase
MGVDVLLTGPMPTPGIAFTACTMRADAAIVISASHNPYEDNGIKIFSGKGYKLSKDEEEKIQVLIASGAISRTPPSNCIGKARRIDDAIGRYIEFCKRTFPADLTLDGMKLVLDCANGATYKMAPTIFSELGAQVTTIHAEPDGTNINDNCGTQHTADLSREVKRVKADAGLSFDGDGDRFIGVDEKGAELTGDHTLAICAENMMQNGTLGEPKVVITPMSNLGLRQTLHRMGIDYIDAEVGDRNVLKLMIENNIMLGGEQSGHIIFRHLHTTGDGIISALQCLAAMKRQNRKLSDMARLVKIAPQVLLNIKVSRRPPLEDLPSVTGAIRKTESQLGANGRVLVRYSGTEMLCRVMVEGPTIAQTSKSAQYIAKEVADAIG